MMADIIDHAQELDRQFNERALAANRKRREFSQIESLEEQVVVNGIHYCIDCGDDIPAGRIEAKPDAVRCTDCQGKKEKK
jgi:DnaK suppressor protein